MYTGFHYPNDVVDNNIFLFFVKVFDKIKRITFLIYDVYFLNNLFIRIEKIFS